MFEEPAIAALFGKLMEKPHFVTVFSHVVLRHTPISEEFIDDLSNSLQLSSYEKQVLGKDVFKKNCAEVSIYAFVTNIYNL